MRVLYIQYSTWKSVTQTNNLAVFEQSIATDTRRVWAGAKDVVYKSDIRPADYSDYNSTFPSRTNVPDEDEALANILGLVTELDVRTSDGKVVVSAWPTEGSRKTVISHNWADPTTWVENSVQVTEETPSTTTPLLVYELAQDNIIDVYHAKVWEEDKIPQYRVLVETSDDAGATWDAATEEDPHEKHVSGTNGDYVLNYDTGVITFHSALPSGTIVRASYYYADMNGSAPSAIVIAPTAGKTLKMRRAEVQFTTDIEMRDTVVFETFGYVDVFAPQLVDNPYPSGTKIPISSTIYKSMRDFYNEANGAQPTYPALGGSNWRGLTDDVIVLQWDYAAVLPLSSAAGMEVHIYLQHHEPFGGSYATATLYGLSEDE